MNAAPMNAGGWCDYLNAHAAVLLANGEAATPFAALVAAAREHDLVELARDGICVAYATPNGQIVNLWTEGPAGAHIGEGAAGYNDCLDWYAQLEEGNE